MVLTNQKYVDPSNVLNALIDDFGLFFFFYNSFFFISTFLKAIK